MNPKESLTFGVHWTEDSYPAWCAGGTPVTRSLISPKLNHLESKQPPLLVSEIADIINDAQIYLGFQFNSAVNVFELLMSQLDSRASRTSALNALVSLHSDYIGGPQSNYHKWFFVARMDLEQCKTAENVPTLSESQASYQLQMESTSYTHKVTHLAVYLLCWGEANQVRYMPECLCFLFKCALDHLISEPEQAPEEFFLDSVVTPIYNAYRDFNFEFKGGKRVHKDKDHRQRVGYDDMNQLFWSKKSLDKLMASSEPLMDQPAENRYLKLGSVEWKKAFKKTYRETRTSWHLVTNYSRIWILHATTYWFYTAVNSPSLYTPNYDYTDPLPPATHIQWTVIALGGALGPLIALMGLLGERIFVPSSSPLARKVYPRIIFLVFMAAVILTPSIYILAFSSWTETHNLLAILAGVQMSISVILSLYLSVQPPSGLFGSEFHLDERHRLASSSFVNNFHPLSQSATLISWGVTGLVFVSKLVESYFFLTLSLRDPIRELSILDLSRECVASGPLVQGICKYFPLVILVGVVFLDMILFYLDTYLWYVVVISLLSMFLSFHSGISIWSPWKNIYSKLPLRIRTKILIHKDGTAAKVLWNAIVRNLFAEYLITREQASKLAYDLHESMSPDPDKCEFFLSQEDGSQTLQKGSEVYRRISFFAQSLSSPIPESTAVENMPSFTVLIPHYTEQILLDLKDIISTKETGTKLTVLEYLQTLHPHDWKCFAEEQKHVSQTESLNAQGEEYDIPFNTLGFSSSLPKHTLKTRLWCSQKSQTLYRTVAGFMKYKDALTALSVAENSTGHNSGETLQLVKQKFRLLVASQMLSKFDFEKLDDMRLLMLMFPELQIAYIQTVTASPESEPIYYSCLMDSSSGFAPDKTPRPRLVIRLSGNPILGDGKSDNQNHALIFYRGEYIQLVDSNQDNYLEECLKIRNVLKEFQDNKVEEPSYNCRDTHQVAFVGAREFIFSGNVGVLGDVAAGKEETFGTLFARSLSKISGKLHYGHPDFASGVFLTTRGGVSKAQKSLHLNEDIYAGMNTISRGGIIKHCDYYQCGKGRDLGFSSILNFVTKIGAGMGEQVLSRDQYFLGTKLPFNRLIPFYYSHAGFHLNNVLIMLSINAFTIVLIWMASVASIGELCKFNNKVPVTDEHLPLGCRNMLAVMDWVRRCVLSIFSVMFISILPLLLHEIAERGIGSALLRLLKHLGSLSMFLEVFICRIYAEAFSRDLSIGGAKYNANSRGFAIKRVPAYALYLGYSSEAIYFGARCLLLLTYTSAMFWHPALLWFWVTTVSLCLAPFIFNPHQFDLMEFFLDYKRLLGWFSEYTCEAGVASWSSSMMVSRARLTGASRRREDVLVSRPSRFNLITTHISGAALLAVCVLLPYIYRASRLEDSRAGEPLSRVFVCAGLPLVGSTVVLIVGVFVSSLVGPWIKCYDVLGRVMFNLQRYTGFLLHLCSFWILYLVEDSFGDALLGIIAVALLETLVILSLTVCLMPRQRPKHECSDAWWTGRWSSLRLGFRFPGVFFVELLCKVCDSGYFTLDFLLCHAILSAQLPMLAIPYIDRLHSFGLLWLQPSKVFSPAVSTLRTRRQKLDAAKYAVVYLLMLGILALSLCLPVMLPPELRHRIRDVIVGTGVFGAIDMI